MVDGMETLQSFVARCAAWCGGDIRPGAGTPGDILGGQVIARRGSLVLVTTGYPVGEDEDGTPIYGGALVVDLAGRPGEAPTRGAVAVAQAIVARAADARAGGQ